MIPHITDEIKQRIKRVAESEEVDVVITEIGGTVGDIESLPFLEALRQFSVDQGRGSCMFIHLTLVPFLGHAGELKTKPTQHSVQELRRIGIQPDMVMCRCEEALGRDIREKIALFANLPGGLGDLRPRRRLDLPRAAGVPGRGRRRPDPRALRHLRRAARPGRVGGAGRAPRRRGRAGADRAGRQVHPARGRIPVGDRGANHAGIHHGAKVEVSWVDSERLGDDEARRELAACDGILIPGGFGVRGHRGQDHAPAASRARRRCPYLGICLGMQIAVADFARHVVGLEGANSTEFDPETPYPVIDLLPEQKEVRDMGGTMRLGADPVKLHEGTRAREVYGEAVIYERHRHRYEVNNHLRKRLEHAGLVCSGTSPDERLVEVVELPEHPFFVASQFHPEFKSRPLRPQPLFREFVGAAVERVRGRARGSARGRRPRSALR